MPTCSLQIIYRKKMAVIEHEHIIRCVFLLQSQYKFIYKAIADYVDLYNSKDDEEYQYSVPVNAVSSSGVNGSIKRTL